MSSSVNQRNLHIEQVEFDDSIRVHLSSGDVLAIPYDYTRKLASASRQILENYHLIGEGVGIHFEDIDEDISLNGIIRYKREHELLAG